MLSFTKGIEPENLEHFRVNPLDHVGLVFNVVVKYLDRGFELDDLILYGVTGLLEGCQRFDETRGVRFSTYATYWIRKAIREAFRDELLLVRVPVYMYARRNKVDREEINQDELTPKAQKNLEIARRIWEASFQGIVQDNEKHEYRGNGFDIPDYRDDQDFCQYKDDCELLLKGLAKLEAHEHHIVVLLYYQEKTLQQAAEIMGLSKSSIRRVRDRALQRLRENMGVVGV